MVNNVHPTNKADVYGLETRAMRTKEEYLEKALGCMRLWKSSEKIKYLKAGAYAFHRAFQKSEEENENLRIENNDLRRSLDVEVEDETNDK